MTTQSGWIHLVENVRSSSRRAASDRHRAGLEKVSALGAQYEGDGLLVNQFARDHLEDVD
jgi:hypothetical protein